MREYIYIYMIYIYILDTHLHYQCGQKRSPQSRGPGPVLFYYQKNVILLVVCGTGGRSRSRVC